MDRGLPAARSMGRTVLFSLLALPALLALAPTVGPLAAQTDWDAVEIRVEQLTPSVYVLFGQGGNIGVSIGEDGVFLIDDQFAPLTEKVRAAIAEATDQDVRWVFNTHWHGDHTGGNENLGGAGALIVAHENVRERMSVEQVLERVGRPVSTTAASPDGALPVVTFTESISFHINGDELRAFHVEHAHTDGDAIVMFVKDNVVHMGDTFFRDRFPFIDTATGGSIDGIIAAAGAALAVMDDETQVIPGHGAMSTRENLQEYRDALKGMRDAVHEMMEAGHSLEEIQAARPIRTWAEAWSQSEGAEEGFVATIHYSLSHGH